MEKLELRILPTTLTTEDDGMYVEGLVNETEKLSHVLGIRKKFREKISKGAFKRAIERENRIDFLAEHDNRMLLATTQNGSLDIFEDEQGLKIRAKIAPTSYGKDIYTLMKEGMVGHMSFGFKALSDKWSKGEDGILVRTVEDLNLFEVSAVRNPAYPQSAISARGIEVVEDVEIPDYVENEEKEEVREMENIKTETSQEVIEVSLEDFRNLVDTCKNLTDEVRELKEKLEQREVQEVKVEEKVEDEQIQEVEVKEEKTEEKTEEERSIDLSSYFERLKKIEIKGE